MPPPIDPSPGLHDLFRVETHGEVLVVVPSHLLETFDSTQVDDAAELLTTPLRDSDTTSVVVDLSAVDYFGSSFLRLLLRCSRAVQSQGGQMALCGVSKRARELLHLTSLDIVWPIYDDRTEAFDALGSD